jgi:lipopolysaccharide/colanic/teichoic acid biosynthesis glycosyltransferase
MKREIRQGIPRGYEFVIALCGMILLSPVLLVCAVLVKVSSPGSILFRQLRVGRNGTVFLLYKFRTMVVSNKGSKITAKNDRRITPVGKFLRMTKLDELPEIFNVLKGDMSFVGPRPEVSEFVDLSNPAWKKVLSVRPGISDPTTIQLRNEESVLAKVEDKEAFYIEVLQPFKLQCSLDYLYQRSAMNDINVIVDTLMVILFPETVPTPNVEKRNPVAFKQAT